MKLGTCLPKLRKITPDIIKLAKQFDVVSPLDWLCPVVLVFEGVTTQHQILKDLSGFTEVRGHALIPCKQEYLPTIWGGTCRGKDWNSQKVSLSLDQQKALFLNHIINTVRRFPSIKKWDLLAGNVKANGNLRFNFLEECLDRAIIADASKSYYLDELLCTSFSRWKKIISMASNENIGGIGIQVHVHNNTDFKETFTLLEKVLKLAKAANIKVDLSEVGYWTVPDETEDTAKVKSFVSTIKSMALDYNVQDFIWWGLTPYQQLNLQNTPKIISLFDTDFNPTIVYNTLIG
jgi:GH35 family endo-1,4-beta-xylanase